MFRFLRWVIVLWPSVVWGGDQGGDQGGEVRGVGGRRGQIFCYPFFPLFVCVEIGGRAFIYLFIFIIVYRGLFSFSFSFRDLVGLDYVELDRVGLDRAGLIQEVGRDIL